MTVYRVHCTEGFLSFISLYNGKEVIKCDNRNPMSFDSKDAAQKMADHLNSYTNKNFKVVTANEK